MNFIGFSEGFHDAGMCIINHNSEILYAGHSERYSKQKGDKWLHSDQIKLIPPNGLNPERWNKYAYYEKLFWKNSRFLYSGQDWDKNKRSLRIDKSYDHHKSHAAAGYYTSPFDDCNILVVDSVGEWTTVSIWDNMSKIHSRYYPYSLGLFYSAITRRIGLKPNEDEYITMGMAAYGEPIHNLEKYLEQDCHRGLDHILPGAKNEDIAASAQSLFEEEILKLVELCPKKNLVIMGGCALNCKANSRIKDKNIWIMPNPGDCGSSIGAAALMLKQKLKWKDPYLGYNIKNEINPNEVVKHLLKHSYCGIASGRAEFGPRALGNRSLIADPRKNIRDTINTIKKRQKFRPFAPAILQEYAEEYFRGPMNAYMQFVAHAKHDYESVTHIDGTARVQVVSQGDNTVLRTILEEWYNQTGCPMLLNTSLNIKGKPIVNDEHDAKEFEALYNVKVF